MGPREVNLSEGPFQRLRRRRREGGTNVPQVKLAQLKGGMIRLLDVNRAQGSMTRKTERLTHSETHGFSTKWV